MRSTTQIGQMVSTILTMVLIVCLQTGTSQATVNIDITFESGAMPADFGFGQTGSPTPSSNIANGVWTNNVPDSQSGGFAFFESGTFGTTPLGQVTIDSIDGPYVHGIGEITLSTNPSIISTNLADQFVINMIDDTRDIKFSVGWLANDNIQLRHFQDEGNNADPGQPGNLDNFPLADFGLTFGDGQKHTIGWELHFPTKTVAVYFDDVLLGSNTLRDFNYTDGDEGVFGDSTTRYAHSEVWDRWTLQEGRIPEPATLGLMVSSLGLLVIRRRHRC